MRSSASGAAPRRRLRSTTRLAVQLFLLAVLVTLAAAGLALAQVRWAFEAQLHDELAGIRAGWESALSSTREETERSLSRIDDYLRAENSPLLERLLLARGNLIDAARPLMLQQGLDLFEILDDEGRILSSGHRPERIDLVDASAMELPAERAVLAAEPLGEGTGPAVVARHAMRLGTQVLLLAGGQRLDRRLLERVAGREAAVLAVRDPDGLQLVPGGAPEGLLDAVREWVDREDGDAGPTTLEARDGTRWLAERATLADWTGRRPLGALVFAVNRGRFDEPLARLRLWFLALGTLVGLLAALAGVLIARSTTRPLGDLVHAFDAIAAGEADYTFPVRGGDEVQDLLGAFSRMHRALESQRQRSVAAERVAAWREVARHVAHEVKNPLAPIRLTVENLVRARRRAPEQFERMFEEGMRTILDEVQQLSRIVGEFTEFARLPLPSLRPTDLHELIERAVELYASEPGVRIVRAVRPEMPAVELDPDQVSRALKNVIGNAIEASRDAPAGKGETRVEIRAGVAEDTAEIEVSDNGPGFSEEAARRIFEPYFTTKEHGTGLGMALAYRIVVEHGGVIFVENLPEGGARVVIRLPLTGRDRGEVAGREAYG